MLFTTQDLAAHLKDPSWIVFDCRHDLMDKSKGEKLYAEGHIPGAHFARVESDLSGEKNGSNGRHPLPSSEAFLTFLASHGVTPTSTIIAYDDAGGAYAARLWWMARWVGLSQVGLLDGGIGRWIGEKRPIEAETPFSVSAPLLAASSDASRLVSSADVVRRMGDSRTMVIDARAPERYRGEVEPIDPVAGHIPGSVNRFFKANLNPDLTFRPAAELKREFESVLKSVPPEGVMHQCGSGITACVNLFAMEYAGLPGSKLYGGSWSEWVADPSRPVTQEPKP